MSCLGRTFTILNTVKRNNFNYEKFKNLKTVNNAQ